MVYAIDLPEISIIVPMLNAEDTIVRCVNSLLGQSYSDMEIILVDNGSVDNTLELCRSLGKDSNRIKIYECEQRGVSAARNVGLDKALGNYVVFVDSDDYLSPDAVESMMMDRRAGSVPKLTPKTNVAGKTVNQKTFYTKEEYIKAVMKNEIHGSVCGMLLERKWLVSERFDEKTSYMEDFLFLLHYLESVQNIHIVNGIYYYMQRFDSITQSGGNISKNIVDMNYSLEAMEEPLTKYFSRDIVQKLLLNKKVVSMEWKLSCVTSYSEAKKILREEALRNIFDSLIKENPSLFYNIFFKILYKKHTVMFFIYARLRQGIRKSKIKFYQFYEEKQK